MADKLKSLYSKGRTTISKEVRDLADIKEGDIFIITVKNKKIILKKAKVMEEK